MRPVAITLLVALCGCSAFLSKPPPTTPMSAAEDCRSSPAPPVGDLVAGVVTGVAGVGGLYFGSLEKYLASRETDPSWDPHTKVDANANRNLALGVVAVPAAVALLISAGYGFRSAKECRGARRELMRAGPPRAAPLDLRRDLLPP